MAQVPPITAASRWLTSASSVISFVFPSADPDPFRADLARRRLPGAGHRIRPAGSRRWPEGV